MPLAINAKKIVCSNFSGNGYSDNPGAIANEIIAQNLGYEIVWIINSEAAINSLPKSVVAVKHNSLRSIYHLRTAKIWIDNCRKMPYVRKRSGQIYIQTWHGFALKKIEKDAANKLERGYIRMAKYDSTLCDLIVSNSRFMTGIYKDSFWYRGPILEVGSPRNDLFFDDTQYLNTRVKDILGIAHQKKIFLYAPTFRHNMKLDVYDLNYGSIVSELQTKFGGEWVVAVRMHPLVAHKSKHLKHRDVIYDASDYPSMQELLVVADVLVTDYSSSMFDFMLTKKPCFLYANDIENYSDDRGFYYGIETVPFDIAHTNKELCAKIEGFNSDEYEMRIDGFIADFQIVDRGVASKNVVKWITSHV